MPKIDITIEEAQVCFEALQAVEKNIDSVIAKAAGMKMDEAAKAGAKYKKQIEVLQNKFVGQKELIK